MASTTLFTFMIDFLPSSHTVELFGSWDNFTVPYPMHKDTQKGHGHWFGCHSFKTIICDGDPSQATTRREGALRMGGTYWYYYQVDGDVEMHDPAQPYTTTCPLLPGQAVNVLEVPIDDSPVSPLAHPDPPFTICPKDRYVVSKLVPTQRASSSRPPLVISKASFKWDRQHFLHEPIERIQTAIVDAIIMKFCGHREDLSKPDTTHARSAKRPKSAPPSRVAGADTVTSNLRKHALREYHGNRNTLQGSNSGQGLSNIKSLRNSTVRPACNEGQRLSESPTSRLRDRVCDFIGAPSGVAHRSRPHVWIEGTQIDNFALANHNWSQPLQGQPHSRSISAPSSDPVHHATLISTNSRDDECNAELHLPHSNSAQDLSRDPNLSRIKKQSNGGHRQILELSVAFEKSTPFSCEQVFATSADTMALSKYFTNETNLDRNHSVCTSATTSTSTGRSSPSSMCAVFTRDSKNPPLPPNSPLIRAKSDRWSLTDLDRAYSKAGHEPQGTIKLVPCGAIGSTNGQHHMDECSTKDTRFCARLPNGRYQHSEEATSNPSKFDPVESGYANPFISTKPRLYGSGGDETNTLISSLWAMERQKHGFERVPSDEGVADCSPLLERGWPSHSIASGRMDVQHGAFLDDLGYLGPMIA